MHLQAAVGSAGLIVILASGGPAAASRQLLEGPHIVVGVVNEAGVSLRIIRSGKTRIAAIYEAIGVAIVWVDTEVDDPEACIVKIVDEGGAEAVNAPPEAIGMAYSNGEGGGGGLVYVFYDRIEHVSGRNQLDGSAMLGAAIAHELGHLLLPSGSHSTQGLMRAGWNRSDILTADGPGLRFTAEQGARIRAKLESRRQQTRPAVLSVPRNQGSQDDPHGSGKSSRGRAKGVGGGPR